MKMLHAQILNGSVEIKLRNHLHPQYWTKYKSSSLQSFPLELFEINGQLPCLTTAKALLQVILNLTPLLRNLSIR